MTREWGKNSIENLDSGNIVVPSCPAGLQLEDVGECKDLEYVEVDMDEEGSEARNNISLASDGDEEMPPAVKIGPPKRKGKRIPTHTKDPVQVPDDSMLFSSLPGPSPLPLPKHVPQKRISKTTTKWICKANWQASYMFLLKGQLDKEDRWSPQDCQDWSGQKIILET